MDKMNLRTHGSFQRYFFGKLETELRPLIKKVTTPAMYDALNDEISYR